MAIVLVVLVLCVAFANGANDVSKGIATLAGAGVGSYRRALAWGAAWTFIGALAAALVARGFVPVFSGRGILVTAPPGLTFPVSVAAGVIGWLFVATRTGLPVSTTHALVGGLVGTGVAAAGPGGVRWIAVVRAVGLPLALSPLLALGLVFVVLPVVRFLFRRLNGYCVCVEHRALVLAPTTSGPNLEVMGRLEVLVGTDCPPRVVGRLDAPDALHWLSAALTTFTRAMNDAPKILALGIAAQTAVDLAPGAMIALVALAMTAGSGIAGSRVTQTLAEKVTRISPSHGLAANLVTSMLVGLASTLAMPVSTTHVSTGAIIGIGINGRHVHWKLVRGLLVAWLVTLPIAAALAALAYGVLER